MNLIFEKIFPYLFGVIAVVLWHQSGVEFPKNDPILSATLTVSGIFVGFLATAKAILLSMNSPLIAQLKATGYMNELVMYIGQAIWVNLFFCVANVVGFFVLQTTHIYSAVWILAAVCALMTFVRVAHIMLQIFKQS